VDLMSLDPSQPSFGLRHRTEQRALGGLCQSP
jgi:hypothetical protein